MPFSTVKIEANVHLLNVHVTMYSFIILYMIVFLTCHLGEEDV